MKFHTHSGGCFAGQCALTADELLAEMVWYSSLFGLTLHEAFRRIESQEEPICGTLAEARLQGMLSLWNPTYYF